MDYIIWYCSNYNSWFHAKRKIKKYAKMKELLQNIVKFPTTFKGEFHWYFFMIIIFSLRVLRRPKFTWGFNTLCLVFISIFSYERRHLVVEYGLREKSQFQENGWKNRWLFINYLFIGMMDESFDFCMLTTTTFI